MKRLAIESVPDVPIRKAIPVTEFNGATLPAVYLSFPNVPDPLLDEAQCKVAENLALRPSMNSGTLPRAISQFIKVKKSSNVWVERQFRIRLGKESWLVSVFSRHNRGTFEVVLSYGQISDGIYAQALLFLRLLEEYLGLQPNRVVLQAPCVVLRTFFAITDCEGDEVYQIDSAQWSHLCKSINYLREGYEKLLSSGLDVIANRVVKQLNLVEAMALLQKPA